MARPVLVVDDEQDVLNVLSEILGSMGCKVYRASNGIKAMEIMANIRFDLIITDLIMPEMDGLNFLKRIKEKGKHVPIVITAGIDPQTAMIDFKEYGISEFIKKPFTIDDVNRKLQKYLINEPWSSEVLL